MKSGGLASLHSLHAVADPRGGGGATGSPPKKKIGSNMFFFLSECFKNKAQIAQESIKTTLELPGP